VIDTASNTVVATIPVGSDHINLGMTPDGAFVYVPELYVKIVVIIATASNSVVATLPISNPGAIAFTPDGTTTPPPDSTRIRWDITKLKTSSSGETSFNPGGAASALANDRSKITLTGSGTFIPGVGGSATGGGTWQTFDPAGVLQAQGTYQVRAPDHFSVAAGVLPPLFTDLIGEASEARAGLAIFEINYSDGKRRVLVVGSRLDKTPGDVFEGVTATRGTVNYWNRKAPTAKANHALFHRLGN
jgi:hypothetical protein